MPMPPSHMPRFGVYVHSYNMPPTDKSGLAWKELGLRPAEDLLPEHWAGLGNLIPGIGVDSLCIVQDNMRFSFIRMASTYAALRAASAKFLPWTCVELSVRRIDAPSQIGFFFTDKKDAATFRMFATFDKLISVSPAW